jgi:hypothetical protein
MRRGRASIIAVEKKTVTSSIYDSTYAWRDNILTLKTCTGTYRYGSHYSYAFPYFGTVSHPYFPSAHRGQRCYHVKNNNYYIFWVRVCSLRCPARNAHAPCCHIWPDRLQRVCLHRLVNGRVFERKRSYLLTYLLNYLLTELLTYWLI